MAVNRKFSGLVGIDGTPQFRVDIRAFEKRLQNQSKPRNGRGTGRWSKSRAFRPGGSLVMTGNTQLAGFPLPDTWRDQTGTITLQYTTGTTSVLSVRVDQVTFSLDKEGQDLWKVSLVCEILASPSLSGWGGTQPSATSPTASNLEVYDGLSKTHDPKNLQTSATRMFDVWPMGDTDAAERQAIADVIGAASAPFPNAKVKYAQLLPSRDSDAGTVTVQYNLTDSEEDVVNPQTSTTVDPNKLESTATAAGVFSSPVSPGGDFVEQTTTTQEIHDNATQTNKQYGLLDTKQKREFPQTVTGNDPYDLEDNATICNVHNSSTIPADPVAPLGQLTERETTQINRYRWQTVWKYSNLNSEQKIEFPAAEVSTDPSALQDTDRQSDVTDSSTAPSTPATRVSGLVLRKITSRRVGGTPEKWLHVWEFGRTTTAEDITFPGTVSETDYSNLEDRATITLINASSTAPGTPAAPLGQIVRVTSEQLTDAGKWKHTFLYENNSTSQNRTFPKSPIETDPKSLNDEEAISGITSGAYVSSSPPSPTLSGVKHRRTVAVRVGGTPEQWQYTYYFARKNTEDDVEMDGSEYTVDQSGNVVSGSAKVTVVESDGTPDGGVTVSGFVLRDVEKKQLHDSKWAITYVFGQTTHEDDIELPGTIATDDPSNLVDEATVTVVNSSSTYPIGLDTPPSGLKLRGVRSVQITNGGKWVHKGEYGRRNTEDDEEMGGTAYDVDESALQDKASVTVVEADGTPDGGVTVSGLVLRNTTKKQLHDSKWAITYHFDKTTSEEDVTYPGSISVDDSSNLIDEATVTLVNSSSSYPVALDTPPSGLVLRTVRSQRLTDAGKWKHTGEYGRRTVQQDHEYLKSESTAESGKLEQKEIVVRVQSSATPDSTALNPDSTNLSLGWSVSHRETAGLWVHAFHFTPLTPTEEMTARFERYETDPVLLNNENTRVLFNTTSTPDAAPSVSGQVHYKTTVTRVGKAKYRYVYEFRYRTSADELEAQHTETTTDVSGLESTAVTADVWLVSDGAPVTPTLASFVLRNKRDIELPNPLYRLRIYRWGLTTPQQDIEYPGSKVRFNQLSPLGYHVTQVKDSATSVVTLGNTLLDTAKTDPTIYNFDLERLNGSKYRETIEYRGTTLEFEGRCIAGRRLFDHYFDGTSVKVWVSDIVQQADQWLVLIEPQELSYGELIFSLRRRLSANGVPMHFDKIFPNFTNPIGFTRNADWFVGLDPLYVSYEGNSANSSFAITNPHVCDIGYQFRLSTRGHYWSRGVKTGWLRTTTDCSGLSVGWRAISFFGWTGGGYATANYDDFLA